ATLSAPVIPEAAEKLAAIFGTDLTSWPSDQSLLSALQPSAAFQPPQVLFKKIEDDDVNAWAERFGAPR
ncbi:MAG: methionine--tRNA ligase, partial [Pseudomonadota bacterium]